MGQLEIKHLKMVRAIHEAGTMTRAAKTLCLTQSALSQQLKDIETRLGTHLFSRAKKRMTLTPAGKRVLAAAERVMRVLRETELDVGRMVAGETGELRVGTQCIFCYRWLPRVMGQFQDRFPNVEVELGNSLDLSRELSSAVFDLVITVLPLPDNAASIPLFEDEMAAILPLDHPLTAKSHIEFSDFSGVNLISVRPRQKNVFYQEALTSRGIEPKRFMTVEDPSAMIEMVAAGFGISMAPMWAIQSLLENRSIQARSVTASGLFLTWQAAFLNTVKPPLFLTEFIRMVGRAHIASPPRFSAA